MSIVAHAYTPSELESASETSATSETSGRFCAAGWKRLITRNHVLP